MKTHRFTTTLLCALAFLVLLNATTLAATTFSSALNGFQQVPANLSPAAGTGTVVLNASETQITATIHFIGLTTTQTSAAIRGPARPGANGPVVFNLPFGNFSGTVDISAQQAAELKAGLWYFEVGSSAFPAGEIRGQIIAVMGTSVPFPTSGGALDATFGTSGILTTAIGSSNDVAQAVAVQPDGKIIAAGFAFNGTNNDFAIIRYNPDGTLDSSFDGDGIGTAALGAGNDEAFAVAIQPDGRIILAGQTFNGADTDIALARFNPDGALDTTFDTDGRVVVAAGTGIDLARSVAIQPDGKIVVAGNGFNGINNDIAVVRFEANGSLDAGFDGNAGNGNGIVMTPVGTHHDNGYGLAVQPDGKIAVAGFFFNATSNDTVVLRYNADGTLDTGFAGDGISTIAFSPETDEALAMTLQPDGKIVIAGCIRNGGLNDFLLARYNLNGSLDTSFSADGSIIVPFSTLADISFGVTVQPDGTIVAAGFGSNGTNNDFSVTRVNADGLLDTSFDGDGRVQTMIGISADSANAVAIQQDGKIIVAGRAVIGSTADFALARYGYGANAPANDGFINLGPTTAIRFDNAFRAGTSSVNLLNSAAVPPLPAGWSFVGSPRLVQTTALFSGDITVRITLPAHIDLATFNAVRVLQFDNGVWTDKTATSPVPDFATRSVYARISTLAMLAAATPNGPVAGTASISGKLLTGNGRPVSKAIVRVTNSGGATTYAVTNSFGYFRFTNLTIGDNYVIRVAAKRHTYAPLFVSVNENITDLILAAQ